MTNQTPPFYTIVQKAIQAFKRSEINNLLKVKESPKMKIPATPETVKNNFLDDAGLDFHICISTINLSIPNEGPLIPHDLIKVFPHKHLVNAYLMTTQYTFYDLKNGFIEPSRGFMDLID